MRICREEHSAERCKFAGLEIAGAQAVENARQHTRWGFSGRSGRFCGRRSYVFGCRARKRTASITRILKMPPDEVTCGNQQREERHEV